MSVSSRASAVLIPAAVFQSVLFGGAYGTGREVAEFITRHGPVGGLFAIAVVGGAFAIILTLCFELARVLNTYDYRTFFSALIGRGWVAYEVLLVVSIPLVLAVNASAASAIMHDQFGLPGWIGVLVTFGTVVVISYFGRNAVREFDGGHGRCARGRFSRSPRPRHQWRTARTASGRPSNPRRVSDGWSTSALQYSLYNVAVIPIILYCARDIRTTGESVVFGADRGSRRRVFRHWYFTPSSWCPTRPFWSSRCPIYTILRRPGEPGLSSSVYVVLLLFMIITTVTGLLHGFNERLDAWHLEGVWATHQPVRSCDFRGIRDSRQFAPVRAGNHDTGC